jgi:UDP-GlcNAc:undecaprenyl-phosphate/decaprenyl-phosphate GlcNAc-1-phosphate transferase
VLAVISGGKIATALLIMGVPILDVVWIIGRRLRAHKKVFVGDSKHLHFRLLAAGMSQRQVVIFLSIISLAFGSVSFFFTTQEKVFALVAMIIFMLILATILVNRYEKKM